MNNATASMQSSSSFSSSFFSSSSSSSSSFFFFHFFSVAYRTVFNYLKHMHTLEGMFFFLKHLLSPSAKQIKYTKCFFVYAHKSALLWGFSARMSKNCCFAALLPVRTNTVEVCYTQSAHVAVVNESDTEF